MNRMENEGETTPRSMSPEMESLESPFVRQGSTATVIERNSMGSSLSVVTVLDNFEDESGVSAADEEVKEILAAPTGSQDSRSAADNDAEKHACSESHLENAGNSLSFGESDVFSRFSGQVEDSEIRNEPAMDDIAALLASVRAGIPIFCNNFEKDVTSSYQPPLEMNFQETSEDAKEVSFSSTPQELTTPTVGPSSPVFQEEPELAPSYQESSFVSDELDAVSKFSRLVEESEIEPEPMMDLSALLAAVRDGIPLYIHGEPQLQTNSLSSAAADVSSGVPPAPAVPEPIPAQKHEYLSSAPPAAAVAAHDLRRAVSPPLSSCSSSFFSIYHSPLTSTSTIYYSAEDIPRELEERLLEAKEEEDHQEPSTSSVLEEPQKMYSPEEAYESDSTLLPGTESGGDIQTEESTITDVYEMRTRGILSEEEDEEEPFQRNQSIRRSILPGQRKRAERETPTTSPRSHEEVLKKSEEIHEKKTFPVVSVSDYVPQYLPQYVTTSTTTETETYSSETMRTTARGQIGPRSPLHSHSIPITQVPIRRDNAGGKQGLDGGTLKHS